MILLVLIQLGLPLVGIQQSFILGLLCWLTVVALSLYILWAWEKTKEISFLIKLLCSAVILLVVAVPIWPRLKAQYRAEHPALVRQPQPQAHNNASESLPATKEPPMVAPVPTPVPSQAKATKPPRKVPKVQPATPAGPKSEPNPDCIRLGDELDRFKDCSSEMVGNWAIGEADKIDDMAKKSMRDSILPGMSGKDRSEFMAFQFRIFSDKFSKCCARDVRDLRAEILHRLGPPAEDLEEEETYKSLYQAFEFDPQSVDIYATMLRRLGRELKLTLIADLGPIELPHSEKKEPQPSGSILVTVTIQTETPRKSGYILLEYKGIPAEGWWDFPGDRNLSLVALLYGYDTVNPKLKARLG